jgi:hypothetical protein
MASSGAEQPEPWPGCQDVDDGKEPEPEFDPSRISAIVLWLDDNRFLAGQGRVDRGRHVSMTLNWLRPGALRLGETYRVEIRNERGPRRSYRAWLRQIGGGGIALEIIEEDCPTTSH